MLGLKRGERTFHRSEGSQSRRMGARLAGLHTFCPVADVAKVRLESESPFRNGAGSAASVLPGGKV